jgi:hypothetical protein
VYSYAHRALLIPIHINDRGILRRVRDKGYYSVRTGLHPGMGELTLDDTKEQILATYHEFDRKDYFQEVFGYYCVDDEDVWGTAGPNIGAFFFKKLKKKELWPIEERMPFYTEDDMFDVIELLYDYVAKPTKGYYHSFANCGYHGSEFDKVEGQTEFRKEINETIVAYGKGFEISSDGEIVQFAPPGLATLENAKLPEYDENNVNGRVEEAIQKFRHRKSSLGDRRDAVVGLANVLEFLKPKLKDVLKRKDESDLFNIANNFGLRHHNSKQKNDYDEDIWHSWIFYHYLSTIHTVVHLIKRRGV